MVQFGETLDEGLYSPWREHYVQYDRLKRIITRNRFILDSRKSKNIDPSTTSLSRSGSYMRVKGSKSNIFDETTATESGLPLISSKVPSESEVELLNVEEGVEPLRQIPNEETPLSLRFKRSNTMLSLIESGFDINSPNTGSYALEDFFDVLSREIEKINSFFSVKISELMIRFDAVRTKRSNTFRLHHTGGDLVGDLKEYRAIYKELVLLIQFVEYNKTGCVKIVKKHDKVMKNKDLEEWKRLVYRQIFATSLEPSELMELLSELVGRDKILEWEHQRVLEGTASEETLFPRMKLDALAIAVSIFAVSMFLPLYPSDPAASRCFSLVLLAVTMWVLEALPYYATALGICPLAVFLGVFKNPDTGNDALVDGSIMTSAEASTQVYENMWNHTSVLLLGGYTISSAFSRCQLELRLASWMQRKLGSEPKLFILAVMMLGLFLSTWISNTTAPILVSSFVTPIVRDIPSSSKFSKCLLLGLAIACNFGGMMTPISSMQNALAASYLEAAGYPVSFGSWIAMSVPFCTTCVLLSWAFLIQVVNPDDIQAISAIVYERSNIWAPKNMFVMTTSLLTIVLFALSSLIIGDIGDIGIISLLFIAVMYGSGTLSEVDFNSLSWHTLFLIGGGNVLGAAVTSSGLLVNISADITAVLPMESLWPAMICILLFSMSVATFVSHTVAAIILLPLIVQLGTTLGNPVAVVVCSTLAISAAQALPFSSFPNVNSLLIVDDARKPYLTVRDYINTGLPVSIFALILISTIGYYLVDKLLN
jgi:phosphate transporter